MTDSFNCFVIFQRKSFMKFTGILFDVPEELLTVKTALCNDLILSLPGNKYVFQVIIRQTRKKCEIYSNLTIKPPERLQ